ncbi:MAG: alpha/beta hydrolase [Myxococcota bacterium]|nr:alpha/beta hydrolase [Myxococcota bacterium]
MSWLRSMCVLVAVTFAQNGLLWAEVAKPASAYQGWREAVGKNREQRVEYWVRKPCETPWTSAVILVPPLLERAEYWAKSTRFIAALDRLCPAAIYAVSLRGRGQSTAPKHGFEPEHHHTDIATVARTEKLPRFQLVGEGTGGEYALGYTFIGQPVMDALVVINGLPAIAVLPEGWATKAMKGAGGGRYTRALVQGLSEEHGPPVWRLEVAPGEKKPFSRSVVHMMFRLTVPLFVLLERKTMPPFAGKMYADSPSLLLRWFDGSGVMMDRDDVHDTVIGALLLTRLFKQFEYNIDE